MLGVVLAAGESKRMPNKALLPIEGGRPAITSAIDFLHRHGLPVMVVVSPDSAIPLVLDAMYPRLRYVVQQAACGPLHAMRLVPRESRMVFTFCDNIYTGQLDTRSPIATVRDSDNPELDRYYKGWVPRGSCGVAFAGYIVCDPHHLDVPGDTLLEWLNAIKAEPVRKDDEWHDLGTLSSYKEYWNAIVCKVR